MKSLLILAVILLALTNVAMAGTARETVQKEEQTATSTENSLRNLPESGDFRGITVRAGNNSDMNIRLRFQPRIDIGEMGSSRDRKSYQTESDVYLRRLRLEFKGSAWKDLKYALALDSDQLGKPGTGMEPIVNTAFVSYQFSEELAVRFGKAKLPFSRIYNVGSAEQLLIERPVFALDTRNNAKTFFRLYMDTHLMVSGKLQDGLLAYYAAVGNGQQRGDVLYNDGNTPTIVQSSKPLFVARIELSPPGWTEDHKSDAHLGKGRHLTVGADYATQSGIDYWQSTDSEKRSLVGADVSFHNEGLTLQFEYNRFEINSTSRGKIVPAGWYAQAGYYLKGSAVEPVVRYERFEEDSTRPGTMWTTVTSGVNWYLKGHDLKVSANWLHTDFGVNASGRLPKSDSRDIVMLQSQIYF